MIYSHDGLKDSLTNLAAPPLFYEELRREFAKRKRSGEEILVLRLVLEPKVEQEADESKYEGEILEFGHILSVTAREQDLCARMGEREFLLVFTGDEVCAGAFLSRIIDRWSFKERIFRLTYSEVVSGAHEGGLELLNRLDLEILLECPS